MWRYRELLPLFPASQPVTLGEGFTPLVHARALGARARPRSPVHQGRIAQPDELVQGARAVGGDHARARLGATTVSVPSAGNAGNAMAAYAARAGIACQSLSSRAT